MLVCCKSSNLYAISDKECSTWLKEHWRDAIVGGGRCLALVGWMSLNSVEVSCNMVVGEISLMGTLVRASIS